MTADTSGPMSAGGGVACERLAPATKSSSPMATAPKLDCSPSSPPPDRRMAAYPLDILGAESEGMIGYLIEQELGNLLADGASLASLLTQIRVDGDDPAFTNPTKPIGPIYR